MKQSCGLQKCLLLSLVLTGVVALSAKGLPDDPPKITAVAPDLAVTTPGSKVEVHGIGLSPGATVYFDGLQARETNFISASTLEVMTPYLRPGRYQIQLRSGDITLRSSVTFTSLASPVDLQIDRAVGFARQGQTSTAVEILSNVAQTNGDYQVRAFAHYQSAQIYFDQGDWWRWGGEAAEIFEDADKSGTAVQTSWRYRLAVAYSEYLLPISSNADQGLELFNFAVEKDATQSPEPRFFRGLMSARHGNLPSAKADSDFLLSLDHDNHAFRALAAYIAVLAGHKKTPLEPFYGEKIDDARALTLLGEAAYLSDDVEGAQKWWTQAARVYPLGASLAYLAGKRELALGHQRIAAALFKQCTTMAPNGKEAKDANDALAALH